jgi:hypothetical protein
MEKTINAGMVAVLLNKNHGIGWSTCCNPEYCEQLLFDPAIVNMVLSEVDGWEEEVIEYCSTKYPEFYCVPYHLDVYWVRAGRKFYIDENEGYEWVSYPEDTKTFVA